MIRESKTTIIILEYYIVLTEILFFLVEFCTERFQGKQKTDVAFVLQPICPGVVGFRHNLTGGALSKK